MARGQMADETREPSLLDQAYEELDGLLVRRHVEGASLGLDAEIEAAWARLDVLQQAACRVVQQQLDEALAISPDTLASFVQEARTLLAAGS